MAAENMTRAIFQQEMEKGSLMLVDYWAPWCGYCRRIGPAYDKIAQEKGEKMLVAKVNIDEEPLLAHQENIEVIPTLVLYKNGKAIASMVAPESKVGINAFIRKSLEGV